LASGRILRLVLATLAGAGFLLACSGPALVVQDEVHAADAIVVIGGDHKPERVRQAVELFQQGYADIVVMSAGTLVMEGDERVVEAEVMRAQALARGLPSEAILLETNSWSTFENAVYTRQICQERGYGSILLVTSAYHSRRARRIFREVYGPDIRVSVQPAAQDYCPPCWPLRLDLVAVVAYEVQNWLNYWLA
jgi:uncharacterized SAM-binding protein YcdF (DUF218 family)